jgi:flagellar protein FlaG
MTANVTSAGGVPDPTYGSGRRQADDKAVPAASAATGRAAPPPGPDDLMLVIEEDAAVGGFVYKTIDRRTGVVVQKLNRDQLSELRRAAGYAAGAVLRTRA